MLQHIECQQLSLEGQAGVLPESAANTAPAADAPGRLRQKAETDRLSHLVTSALACTNMCSASACLWFTALKATRFAACRDLVHVCLALHEHTQPVGAALFSGSTSRRLAGGPVLTLSMSALACASS